MNIFKGLNWLETVVTSVAAFALAILVFQLTGQQFPFVAALAGAWSGITGVLGFNFGKNEWTAKVVGELIVATLIGACGGLMFLAQG